MTARTVTDLAMTDRERLLCDAIFAELLAFADTHAALRAGRGNSDDLRGFVGWLTSLAENEPERLIGEGPAV